MKPPHIDHYKFGQITIDGQFYSNDLIIFPEHIQDNWWRITGHNLAIQDLREVFKQPPDTLVIGQGAHGRMNVPEHTWQALEQAGIEVIITQTEEACRRYNALSNQRKVAAALHLTC